ENLFEAWQWFCSALSSSKMLRKQFNSCICGFRASKAVKPLKASEVLKQ
ncbi:hypothetical protein A2U01_0054246, partial [Trifolium medium]|nr:hypothetical protein [Trifolium medium]